MCTKHKAKKWRSMYTTHTNFRGQPKKKENLKNAPIIAYSPVVAKKNKKPFPTRPPRIFLLVKLERFTLLFTKEATLLMGGALPNKRITRGSGLAFTAGVGRVYTCVCTAVQS